MNSNGNILLQQIIGSNSKWSFKESIPDLQDTENDQYLALSRDKKLFWHTIDQSLNVVVNNKIVGTNIYYSSGRIGLDRLPLHNYKVDISVPRDTLMTAFHIGDGSFGFSMGNGTTQGFIPEIIGVGSDENDTGLYFVGIAGNSKESSIPLIIIDGRNAYGKVLTNRPILGVTSSNYNKYVLSIDSEGNLNITGDVNVKDVKLNGISVINILKNLQQQIDELKEN
jgi:hypothetical protein